MFKNIKIGNLELEGNVLLAPMCKVTDMPFRKIVKRYGASLVTSEMIASQAMVREAKKTMRMALKSQEEHPMAIQLAGYEPEVVSEAAKIAEDLGASIIDLNMSCPVKKIVNAFSGSALMKDELRASKIMEAAVKAVSVPVTLKMRKGWNEENLNAPNFARIAEENGIQMITIHGRTRAQLFNGKADWPFISKVKDVVKIPVIGNGDVVSLEDAENLLKIAGTDGVMIGRGTYGRPWFIGQVMAYLKNGEIKPDPSIEEQKELVLEHFEAMLEFYGIQGGVHIARKHLGWYSKNMHGAGEFRVKINTTENVEEIRETISRFYDNAIEKCFNQVA